MGDIINAGEIDVTGIAFLEGTRLLQTGSVDAANIDIVLTGYLDAASQSLAARDSIEIEARLAARQRPRCDQFQQ